MTTDVAVPLRDGVRLATAVTLVHDGARRPALLVRTPYSRPAARETLDVDGLARDGWAVVLQDVRGRWDSDGAFGPFVQEADDGADAVAWCATQPWCDGRVVMTGASYLGAAQWAAASRRPAGLVAVNPVLAPASPPPDWLWQGGAFHVGMAAPWALTMRVSTQGVSPQDAERAAAELDAWQRAPEAVPDDRWLRDTDPHYRSWRAPRRAAGDWAEAEVPAFNVVGWHDFFAEAGLAAHVRQFDLRRPVLTVVDEWAHDPAAGTSVAAEALTWLRARLDGEPVETEVRYVVTGDGKWRRSPTWPPPARPAAWFLGADGALTASAPGTAGSRAWLHDPTAPVTSRGGRVLGPFLPLGGALDQRTLERRDDVLVFTGATLEQPLAVIGKVGADLTVTSTASSFDVTVKLCDLHPDGTSVNVVDGITRVDGEGPSVHVDVGSCAHLFAAGHRVRIEVAGSNFPRFDVNPAAPATHTLHWGPAAPSRLTLPAAAARQ